MGRYLKSVTNKTRASPDDYPRLVGRGGASQRKRGIGAREIRDSHMVLVSVLDTS